jgi:Cu-Zn family superoxide dismutase
LAVNPFNKTHGAPTDVARHVGDMGNVRTDGNGVASGTMIDHMIRLMGPHSVIGVSPITPFSLNSNVDR